jgi:hypothetical protein
MLTRYPRMSRNPQDGLVGATTAGLSGIAAAIALVPRPARFFRCHWHLASAEHWRTGDTPVAPTGTNSLEGVLAAMPKRSQTG